jgi:hypothetical protein
MKIVLPNLMLALSLITSMQDGKLVTGRTESGPVMPLIAGVFTAFAARID